MQRSIVDRRTPSAGRQPDRLQKGRGRRVHCCLTGIRRRSVLAEPAAAMLSSCSGTWRLPGQPDPPRNMFGDSVAPPAPGSRWTHRLTLHTRPAAQAVAATTPVWKHVAHSITLATCQERWGRSSSSCSVAARGGLLWIRDCVPKPSSHGRWRSIVNFVVPWKTAPTAERCRPMTTSPSGRP